VDEPVETPSHINHVSRETARRSFSTAVAHTLWITFVGPQAPDRGGFSELYSHSDPTPIPTRQLRLVDDRGAPNA